MQETPSDFVRLRRWLIASVFAVCTLLAVLAGIFIWVDFVRSSRETDRTLQAEALAFSEYASSTLRAADVVLDAAYAEIERKGGLRTFSERALHDLFLQHLRLLSPDDGSVPPHSLLAIDSEGRLFANSLSASVTHHDLSGLDYFQHHRDDPAQEAWLGQLYVSRSSGLKIFVLSRRLNNAFGQFAGVLAVSVRAAHFEHYFDRIGLSPGQSITLLRRDAKPLFRYPMTESFESMTLTPLPENDPRSRAVRGVTSLLSPFDGQKRRVAFERGQQYPTVAIVSQLESELSKEWRQHAWFAASTVLAAIAALTVLLALALRLLRHADQTGREHSKALANLKATEAQLLQAEKLASLGRMVAIFSHDIGGPIGNGRVAITSLREHGHELQQALEGGALKRAALQEHLEMIGDAGRMIESNLDRAADLLNDFKLAAMDQATVQQRSIELAAWLHHLAHTLAPLFKDSPHTLVIEAPEGIILDTCPGPLGQVLSNLVSNARIHAFDKVATGLIVIRACMLSTDNVRITVEDNGIGIGEELRPHIFEPFFTTRAGKGGTGLGLHIVKTLVEETLAGTLRVRSDTGRGTCFEIDLPLVRTQSPVGTTS